MAKLGDKFVIEISEELKTFNLKGSGISSHHLNGGLYRIYGLPNLVIDEEDLRKLKKYDESSYQTDYEQELQEEIKVGDEIYSISYGVGVVTRVYNSTCAVTYKNGNNGVLISDNIKKTGRHFDIEGILKAMREE